MGLPAIHGLVTSRYGRPKHMGPYGCSTGEFVTQD